MRSGGDNGSPVIMILGPDGIVIPPLLSPDDTCGRQPYAAAGALSRGLGGLPPVAALELGPGRQVDHVRSGDGHCARRRRRDRRRPSAALEASPLPDDGARPQRRHRPAPHRRADNAVEDQHEGVVAVAFGTVDPIFSQPVPVWNPLHWQFAGMRSVLAGLEPGHAFWTVFVRTFAYVALSLLGCLLIGYPVAYYLARHARRTKAILLVLLVIPFWVSYLMRMLAWIGLLLPDGLVNKTLMDVGILSRPYGWLDGQASSVVLALIYGYVPYLILPLYRIG